MNVCRCDRLAENTGLEPIPQQSKCCVLPLHQSSIYTRRILINDWISNANSKISNYVKLLYSSLIFVSLSFLYIYYNINFFKNQKFFFYYFSFTRSLDTIQNKVGQLQPRLIFFFLASSTINNKRKILIPYLELIS